MSATEYRDALLDSILGLLWRQWTGVGVAGQVASEGSACVIDPEALLLFSALFGRYDQRLYDLVSSWLVKYGLLVNPTRLKALVRQAPWADTASLAYLSALRARVGDRRWQKASAGRSTGKGGLEPMFFYAKGEEPLYCREKDELAAQYGFQRAPFEYQNKLSRVLPETASTLLLRMRGMYGVSARADILMHLMHAPATVQQLSDISGFARSSVKEVLLELEAGNAAYAVDGGKRNTAFALVRAGELRSFFGGASSRVVKWTAVYNCLGRLWRLVSHPVLSGLSERTFMGELGLEFQEYARPRLLSCGINPLQQLTPASLERLPLVLDTVS